MSAEETDVLDEIRLLARRTAALARAAESVLDDVIPVADDDRAKLEDLAHLLAATSEAASAIARCSIELDKRAAAQRS